MTYEKITEAAQRLYEAKIKTGLYKDYPEEALLMLYDDCLRQVATMNAINNAG